MDLKAIRAGLKALLEDICGISVSRPIGSRAVHDDDQPWVMPDIEGTQAVLSFKLFGAGAVGEDENRYYFEDGSEPPGEGEPETRPLLVNTCGNRKLTFVIKCEAYEAEYLAFEYIEKIRSNLSRVSVNETIASLGCSINDISDARSVNVVVDGRVVSVAVLELVLNTASNLADEPATTIETFEYTSEVDP